MKPKDPAIEFLVKILVIVLNLVTLSFIQWVYPDFIPDINAHGIEIFWYIVTISCLIIFDLTYAGKLYFYVNEDFNNWIENQRRYLKRIRIINVVSLIILTTFMLYGSYLRVSYAGFGPRPPCTMAEIDAYNTIEAINRYFSDPDQTEFPTVDDLCEIERLRLYNGREAVVVHGDVEDQITIVRVSKGYCHRGKYLSVNYNGSNIGWLNE